MAHSEDLRIRVIKAVTEDGLSRNQAARVFRVGVATAIRWVDAFEDEERRAPLAMGGDRRSVLKPCREWLLALRRAQNDLSLDEIGARLLAEHGIKADKSMLSRFFAACGVSFKKNRARQRAGAARRGRSARGLGGTASR
jgi:putative transposase